MLSIINKYAQNLNKTKRKFSVRESKPEANPSKKIENWKRIIGAGLKEKDLTLIKID